MAKEPKASVDVEPVKVILRGYVKWTDKDGVFHKEPLYNHPELLKNATPEQQAAAEEARRLNEKAEAFLAERDAGNTEVALSDDTKLVESAYSTVDADDRDNNDGDSAKWGI